MKQVFQASSDLFGGYQTIVDVRSTHTIQDVTNLFIQSLRKILEYHKFDSLLNKLSVTQFHIHDVTIEDICNGRCECVYVCDHCYQMT